eukprot:CAMPEP_0197036494 /NCGR_PEP_ID=MMETSP1384-20130603/13983_1 /TAXON_ID=29189 /ORGANISM="Ammonia sp." /LENGTH=266 /DNA_ID=CAMNT_0042466677 /DNA_START=30 /DNA_END=830 /DNA_ORIENTATION=-
MAALPKQNRQQMKQQLHGSSANCCNLWCSTIVIAVLWTLANAVPVIYGAYLVSEMDKALELQQNGEWCVLVTTHSLDEQVRLDFYGNCGTIKAVAAVMFVLGCSALPAIVIVIYGLCWFRTGLVLAAAAFLSIHSIVCIVMMLLAFHQGFVCLLVLPFSVCLTVMLFVLYCNMTKVKCVSELDAVPLVDNVQVSEWLNKIGMMEYHELFVQHGIEDVSTALTLTKEDLIEMGVQKLGHRNKIMACIHQSGEGKDVTPAYNEGEEGY